MSRSLLSVAFAAVVVSSQAFAGWTEILSLRAPMYGTFATTARLRTSQLKVIKTGVDCPQVRVNFTAIGRTWNGVPIVLGLNYIGDDSYGNGVYSLANSTIFELQLTSTAGGSNVDCTYSFNAKTLDLD